jgi:hypothetical protein
VKVCVFRTPLEDHPDDEMKLIFLPLRVRGGNAIGDLANHNEPRSRSRSFVLEVLDG